MWVAKVVRAELGREEPRQGFLFIAIAFSPSGDCTSLGWLVQWGVVSSSQVKGIVVIPQETLLSPRQEETGELRKLSPRRGEGKIPAQATEQNVSGSKREEEVGLRTREGETKCAVKGLEKRGER